MTAAGFTGPRTGMTKAQAATLSEYLGDGYDHGDEFHEGDCVGADATATAIARDLGFRIVCHPPVDPSYRAWLPADTTLPQRPYLDRNRDIVDAVGVLFATPDGPERLRSGTWSTIRYARRSGRETVVIMPDGTVTA